MRILGRYGQQFYGRSNSIQSLLFALVLSVSAFAAEPTRYEDVQYSRSHGSGPVFNRGEYVTSNNFGFECVKNILQLTIGSPDLAVYGLEDRFEIVGNRPSQEVVHGLVHKLFPATVQIISAGEPVFGTQDQYHHYKVRLVSHGDSNTVVNPDKKTLSEMDPQEVFVVRGTVIDDRYNHIVIRADGKEYDLSYTPSMYKSHSDELPQLPEAMNPAVGDVIQVAVKQSAPSEGFTFERPLMPLSSAVLIKPSPVRLEEYRLQRQHVEATFSQMVTLLKNKELAPQTRFQGIRRLHRKLMEAKLLPEEEVQRKILLSKIPEPEQPVHLPDRNDQFVVQNLNSIFSVNLNTMTKDQAFAFAKKWADREIDAWGDRVQRTEPINSINFFDTLRRLGMSEAEVVDLAKRKVTADLAAWENQAPHEPRTLRYTREDLETNLAIQLIGQDRSIESLKFLTEIGDRVTANPSQYPKNNFLFYIATEINRTLMSATQRYPRAKELEPSWNRWENALVTKGNGGNTEQAIIWAIEQARSKALDRKPNQDLKFEPGP